MKKTWSMLKISIIDSFTYRGDVIVFTLAGVVQPLILLFVWLAVIASGGDTPLSRVEFINYYLFVLIIKLWTSAWGAPFIASGIRLGKLSLYLIKPVSYVIFQLGNNFGEKILKSIYLFPLVIILVRSLKIDLPSLSPFIWMIIVFSVLMAFWIMFLIDFCIGLSAFWLDEAMAMNDLSGFLMHIFSGQLIPIFALPVLMQRISLILPFRYVLSFPIEILLNKLSLTEIAVGFFIQSIWLLLFVSLANLMWRKGLKRYMATGG